MIARRVLGGLNWRTAAAHVLSALVLLVVAAPAFAATLAVRVNPAAIHLGSTYQIQISGTFKRKRAYLVAFIQYSGKACKANASQELHRTHATGGAYAAGAIRRTQFIRAASFKARSRGPRRVCAYLFARRVKPGMHTRPLARASAVYQVVS